MESALSVTNKTRLHHLHGLYKSYLLTRPSQKFIVSLNEMQVNYVIPHITLRKYYPFTTGTNRMNSKAYLTTLPLLHVNGYERSSPPQALS